VKTYRGDIWLVDYGEPVGREQGYPRPALILHSPLFNLHRAGLAIAAPITSRKRDWPLRVEIQPGISGLRETVGPSVSRSERSQPSAYNAAWAPPNPRSSSG
jgi:mRNA interferase MazF